MWKSVFIFFFVIFSFSASLASVEKFHHLNYEQGLSQSTVNCILKDSRGYFWIGTNDGLNRWDGHSFKVYYHRDAHVNSIAQGAVNTILEDTEGNLWIATAKGGLSKYNPNEDSFYTFKIPSDSAVAHIANHLTDIAFYKDALFASTLTGQLYRFDLEKESFDKVEIVNTNKEVIQVNIINNLVVQNNVFWIASTGGAIKVEKFFQKDNKTRLLGNLIFPETNITAVYYDTKNYIWFGTCKSGAIQKNRLTNEIIRFQPDKDAGESVNNSSVKTFCEVRNGSLWIGTGGGGLNVYSYQDKKFTYYQSNSAKSYSLSSNYINTIYSDNDDNLWLGTYNGGISYTNNHKQLFHHKNDFQNDAVMSSNSVLAFCETSLDNVWIGTDGGGMYVYNLQTDVFEHFPLKKDGEGGSEVITSIRKDGKGKLYIGTFRDGLFVYDMPSGELKNYKFDDTKQCIPTNNVWDIALGHEGEVWIGSSTVVSLFSPKDGSFSNYDLSNKDSSGQKQLFVSCLMVDNKNHLWVGTLFNGIFQLSKKEKQKLIPLVSSEYRGLTSREISCIFQDSQNRIWVGTTDEGLNVYSDFGLGFKLYTEEDGLPNNSIKSIEEDSYGNIWVSTNQGISRVSEENKSFSFRNYNLLDGLQANEFNIHASMRSKKGKLYFGGINGFNLFESTSHWEKIDAGPVVVNSIQIFDKKDGKVISDTLISLIAERSDVLSIKNYQSTICIEYAMLDYAVPHKNTFYYRLLPFQKDWISAGTNRRVTYTNLNPGDYKFQVKGVNSQLIANDTYAEVQLHVHPLFWQSLGFRFFAVLFFVLMAIMAYRNWVKSFHSKKGILEDLVEERTKELKDLNKVLQDRNHEIYQKSEDLISGREELLAANKRLGESYDKIGRQNLELEEHRSNLKDLVKSRTYELEKAKIKAEESEHLKMSFLSNMSHEIRTPMNAIVGFASLLTDEELSKGDKYDYIRQVNTNSESLLVLIDDILDLSKIEANQLRIENTVFEVNNFIRQIFVNWEHLKEKHNFPVKFKFETTISDKDILLKSDQQRVRQVLNNLLDNAFKFTGMGDVVLSCTRSKSEVMFSVSDTGIGISEVDKKYIFSRFRKGVESNKKLYRGAGLGLTISHKLTELIGGRLWVESTVGVGARFFLSLPIHEVKDLTSTVGLKEERSDAEINLSGMKILIAEDEEANLFYLSGMLSKRGANVDQAIDGEEAIKKASLKEYDVILMDIKMPGIDGLEATRRIKMMFPHQVIIAQTAYARPEEENEFRKNGFDHYITKPIKKDLLFQILRMYLKS